MLQSTRRSLTGSRSLREVIAVRELAVSRSDDWDLVQPQHHDQPLWHGVRCV